MVENALPDGKNEIEIITISKTFQDSLKKLRPRAIHRVPTSTTNITGMIVLIRSPYFAMISGDVSIPKVAAFKTRTNTLNRCTYAWSTKFPIAFRMPVIKKTNFNF